MAEIIDEVRQTSRINSAEFVSLTIYNPDGTVANGGQPFTFSSSYRQEIIEGQVYKPLGGLIGVGTQQRDLSVTSFDTTVTLAGVDPANIYMVLGYNIRGSRISIYRGFYDFDYIPLANTIEGDTIKAHLRYTGIVTGYVITEDRTLDMLTYTITINCSNYKTVLENQNPGRYTSPTSWNKFDPDDTSMSNTPNLYGASFNFGMKK